MRSAKTPLNPATTLSNISKSLNQALQRSILADGISWQVLKTPFLRLIYSPEDFLLQPYSAQAMMNVFGISVDEWSGGALSNSGELLTLTDAGGNVVDSVLFDDSDPWPVEPDGEGPSLELKDSATDNIDGANWQFSGGNTGVIINGFEVSGTPGEENSGGGTPGHDLIIDLSNFSLWSSFPSDGCGPWSEFSAGGVFVFYNE